MGAYAVDFFFVLSGFVLWLNYSHRAGARAAGRFLQARWARIYPLHVVTLAVFVFFELAKSLAENRYPGQFARHAFAADGNSLLAILWNLLLLNSHGLTSRNTFNFPAWSIGAEATCYLLFALLMLVFRHRTSRVFGWMLLGFCAVTVLRPLVHAHPSMATAMGVVRAIHGFAIGVILCAVLEHLICRKPRWHRFMSALCAFLVLTGIVVCSSGRTESLSGIHLLSTGIIGILVLEPDYWFSSLLSSLGRTWFGNISYGIYMWHAAVLWVMNRLLCQVLHLPFYRKDGDPFIQCSLAWGNLLLVLTIGITIVLAKLSFDHLEAPLRRRLRPPTDRIDPRSRSAGDLGQMGPSSA